MSQLVFFYNTQRCIACKACQVACKEKNLLETGSFFRRVATNEIIINGEHRLVHFSGSCNHCSSPACVEACPTNAMHKSDDGTVVHDKGKCMGCGLCVYHCPYGAPSLSTTRGCSQKCDSCIDLRQKGRHPACVDACPTRALKFGNLEAFQEQYGHSLVCDMSFLPESSLTYPSLVMKPFCGMKAADIYDADLRYVKNSDKDGVTAFRRDTSETFVVLGTGAAAVTAVAAIRERNRTVQILVIGNEKRFPYSRPMLSKAALRGFNIEEHSMHDQAWYLTQNITMKLGCGIASLNPDKKTVSLVNGETVSYDKCVYALGAESFVPPIPGADKTGVFTVRRDTDIEEIRRSMLKAKNAVVIGGGVIGLEIAWELKKSGLQITVIELANTLMERLLDETTARALAVWLQGAGVHIATGVQIDSILGGEKAESVALKDGTIFPADFVILSTGIKSNVLLAQNAGIQTGRSVKVNEFMETNIEDVYACGDCAEVSGINTGTWTQSITQGYLAGANAAGDKLSYHMESSPILVHVAGISLFSIGDMGKGKNVDYELCSGNIQKQGSCYMINPCLYEGGTLATYCFLDGKLVGASLLGDLHSLQTVRDAVLSNMGKESFLNIMEQEGGFSHGLHY